MAKHIESSDENDGEAKRLSSFQPVDRAHTPSDIDLPDDIWMTVLEAPCIFPPEAFEEVMLHLVKNPNITSSALFRADIFYDSGKTGDQMHARNPTDHLRHLKPEYRPAETSLPRFALDRTFVRQLVPRNALLDKPLIQTCHFFTQLEEDGEKYAVVYLSHVRNASDVPFYHPAVSKLSFLHTWKYSTVSKSDAELPQGSISISYCMFPCTTMTTKLERTAFRLLETVHRHSQGCLTGYQKRAHLDQVIPQRRYQDTYAGLKAKYGKQLAEQWVEATDPGKHVFEDIGIAAFLIELWRDIYGSKTHTNSTGEHAEAPFPGFVDIGCGNGVLVYILLQEGYEGVGIDARRRKTWSIFPPDVQDRLQQRILVPELFQQRSEGKNSIVWHDGSFAPRTFIISNHADELTAWTPLLAALNDSAFIAIPCCSHDLAGSRFRAPQFTKGGKVSVARLPQQGDTLANESIDKTVPSIKGQAAETGSLKRTKAQKKMPSAYSTLCSYVVGLAQELGFAVETEFLRIPSTRNQCIIGRARHLKDETSGIEDTRMRVRLLLERELRVSVYVAGDQWIARARKLAEKTGTGH